MFQIIWQGEVPLVWSHQAFQPITQTFGPPYEADLCCVVKNANSPSGPHEFKLSPLFRSFRRRADWNSACKIAVLVQARATEGDSNALRVEIAWDGQWSDDSVEM